MNTKEIGIMIDLSRGKVLTVDTIKKYATNAKAFGYTYLNLYLEDLITLPQYPQFGYLRGKYTDQEVNEIISHCDKIGLEVYPAIQTLGHMEQFLRWEASDSVRDTARVLNVTSIETENFLRVLISKCKELFPSKKINLGMDEAFDLGQGAVLQSGNQLSQKELYTKHLNMVVEICKECGYETIKIWSDMLFNIYSKTGEKELYSFKENQQVDKINDDVEIIYWNYWTKDTEEYKKVIDIHHKFSNKVSMALGIHTWGNPFYDQVQFDSTKAAILACEDKEIDDILFTMWGDDGSIYNLDSAFYGMYITMCQLNKQEVKPEQFEQITGLDFKVNEAITKIMECGINPLRIIWNDPITNIQLKLLDETELIKIKDKAKAMFIKSMDIQAIIHDLYLKCIINDIDIYLSNDFCAEDLNKAQTDLSNLFAYLEKLWLEEAKVYGIEELQLRFKSKLYRYEFLFNNQGLNDVQASRKEKINCEENIRERFNSISKATNHQW